MSEEKESSESSEELDDIPTVVIDLGSGYTKCGYAGHDYPKSIFPTVVGTQKYQMCMVGMHQRPHYAGKEALNKRGILHLENPFLHGHVKDWDKIENVLQYVYYNELRVSPEDYNTLLTDAPGNPRANREKFVEIFFEKINSVSFFMTISATLALYASGRTCGVVLDSGHSITSTVPIRDGIPIKHQIRRLEIGGHNLTEYLIRQLRYRGHNVESSADKEVIRRVKEKFCYCSLKYDQDEEAYNRPDQLNSNYSKKDDAIAQTYTLPDGSSIKVGTEQYQVPEVMFDPSIIGIEAPSVPELVFHSVHDCARDVKRSMFNNIICAGGNTRFKNFETRLQTEVGKIASRHTRAKVEVIAPADRSISAWLGGSVLASLDSFKELWVTRLEYEEEGNRLIDRFG